MNDAMDAHTTPPWARVPILLAFSVLVAYFVVCWWIALGAQRPAWTASLPDIWWFGNWQMFTLTDKHNEILQAEAEISGAWQDVKLDVLFPTRWESGLRFGRSGFWQSGARLRTLAAATCGRQPQAPTRVRFYTLSWPKRLGRPPIPPKKAKRKDLLTWDCSKPWPLTPGEPL